MCGTASQSSLIPQGEPQKTKGCAAAGTAVTGAGFACGTMTVLKQGRCRPAPSSLSTA